MYSSAVFFCPKEILKERNKRTIIILYKRCVIFGGEIMNRQQKIFVMLMAACMAFTGISTISMASAAEVQPQEKVLCQQEICLLENMDELF